MPRVVADTQTLDAIWVKTKSRQTAWDWPLKY